MKRLENLETFNSLNNNKHHIIQDGQFSLFPEIQSNTPKQDSEFWYFSDIYNIYNDEYAPTYNLDMNKMIQQNLVKPKIISAKKIELTPCTPDFFNNHTAQVKHTFKMGATEYKKANDLQLSRYACWCLAKTIQDNMFSYTYFMSPIIQENITFKDLGYISYQFARVQQRAILTKLNQRFNGAINTFNGTPAALNTKKLQSFFDNLYPQSLKYTHGINDTKSSILDYMGANSMGYLIDGLYTTLFTANQPNKCRNIYQFEQLMHNNLTNARREMINTTGTKPENDIHKTNIATVQSELNRIETEFIKKYANTKLRQ